MRTFTYACGLVFLMSACRTELPSQPETDSGSYTFPITGGEKELSHAPSGQIYVGQAGLVADFSCDDVITGYIKDMNFMEIIDTITTFAGLARLYEERYPSFDYVYSSTFDINTALFPKMEYMLAQECVQDDCTRDMRKAVLSMAVGKQKHKYEEYRNAYTSRQTGIFLMAVIMAVENDAAFLSAVNENADYRDALSLNINIRQDKEFGDSIIRYAEAFLFH
ncbi:MAG: hypothetical protein LBI58_01630 [Tannerellaceae bacterium]|jgi:hypothetical protein|nr:hypothetical protein [Tannerellaceae bacterium]